MSQRVFRKSRVCSNLALPHQFFVDLIFTTFLTQTANMRAVSWWYWIEKPFNRKGWKLLLQFLIFGVDVGNSNLMTRPNTQPNMVLKKKVLKQKILQKKELCIKRSPWLRRPFLPHLMVGWIHIASRGDVISGSFTSGKSESLAPNLGQGTELRERERDVCVFFGCIENTNKKGIAEFLWFYEFVLKVNFTFRISWAETLGVRPD